MKHEEQLMAELFKREFNDEIITDINGKQIIKLNNSENRTPEEQMEEVFQRVSKMLPKIR